MGASFSGAPARTPVDLEALIVATARAAPGDERLVVVAASWLAVYHGAVDGRRLARPVEGALGTDGAPPAEGEARRAAAVLGALLTRAQGVARAAGRDRGASRRTAAGADAWPRRAGSGQTCLQWYTFNVYHRKPVAARRAIAGGA